MRALRPRTRTRLGAEKQDAMATDHYQELLASIKYLVGPYEAAQRTQGLTLAELEVLRDDILDELMQPERERE